MKEIHWIDIDSYENTSQVKRMRELKLWDNKVEFTFYEGGDRNGAL